MNGGNLSVLLQVDNLSFAYHAGKTVFQQVSFSVEKGETFCLLGPNGAGKSTLLNCISGSCSPTSGRILIHGKEITSYSPRELARRIAYVPQTIHVCYDYTVREYLSMGAAPRLGMFASPGKEELERVDHAIELLSLDDLKDRIVRELSGGERQRTAIARAIVQDPELILFDEPTSALDYGNQIRVMRTIQDLSRKGYAIIMTTHNPDQPILLGGKVATLDQDGQLAVGENSDILTANLLTSLYGAELKVVHVEEAERPVCIIPHL